MFLGDIVHWGMSAVVVGGKIGEMVERKIELEGKKIGEAVFH